MADLDIDVVVECGTCGKELDADVSCPRTGVLSVDALPCSDCLKAERQEGYDEGVEDGSHDEG